MGEEGLHHFVFLRREKYWPNIHCPLRAWLYSGIRCVFCGRALEENGPPAQIEGGGEEGFIALIYLRFSCRLHGSQG